MQTQLGLAHFWSQADLVTQAVALLLFLLSVASWMVILRKGLGQWRAGRWHDRAMTAFWSAHSLPEAVEALKAEDRSGVFAQLAMVGAFAAQSFDRNADRSIGAGLNVSESVTRALRSQIVKAQAGIEHGLTFLASVGSTAPFIGLFGTVWGLYHALVGLAGATQVVLDKVAGPVGEALIMTAGGLFVAIPAVLAYNACTRANRIVLAQLDGFAHDLHAYLTTGTRTASLQAIRGGRPA
ncbi:MAG: MotA/TolQ/ExbB proton channel family protein [Rhodocyclales bacterium]|nr:MotA/TolQ/ExbB proton channel family protein [Rhodocyclales bacterium]